MQTPTPSSAEKSQEQGRRRAPITRSDKRSLAFQALYSFDRSGGSEHPSQFLYNFVDAMQVELGDDDFAAQIFLGVVQHQQQLTEQIKPCLKNWSQQRISCCVNLILQMGCWELLYQKQTPGSVVINEYVELSKIYAEEQAYRLVNGVLDQILQQQS